MDPTSFEKYIEKTKQDLAALPEGAYEAELRLQVLALQLLAKGAPVSSDSLVQAWGLPVEHVQAILDQAAGLGTLQLDDAGNLVGMAISLVPSRHKFQVGENTLYAWCAYDAVYTPGVIGASADIESVDPLSSEPILLKISPEGVLESEPEGIFATVVGIGADASGGAESLRCNFMQFFVSEENARTWSAGQPGVSVVTVDQLFDLARVFQIEPARQMGLLGTP